MVAIINNYNKGQTITIEALPLIVPTTPLVNERPRIPINSGDAIVLDASGQLVPNNAQSNRPRVASAIPSPPIRNPRAVRRAGRDENRRSQDPMLLDLNKRSEIDLDLSRRNATVEIDIQPDPPGYWNVSNDPFGTR